MKSKALQRATSDHAQDGVTFDAMIESAKQIGNDARTAAMDHLVQPAVQAVRDVGLQLEERLHNTMEAMEGRLKEMESSMMRHPIRVLACAVGAGVLIGLWLGRK